MAVRTEYLFWDDLRALTDALREEGLVEASFRYGIVAHALRRGARLVRDIDGDAEGERDNFSDLQLFELPDGGRFWDIHLCADNGAHGTPMWSSNWVMTDAHTVERGRAMDAWLDAHPGYYERCFTPIKWSAAGRESVTEMYAWMTERRPVWSESPLTEAFEDVYRDVQAAWEALERAPRP